MAEFQNTVSSSGEMAQRFIEFILMQAQNAAFMLGQIPHPQTGKAEVNLDVARLLIDQLAMLQEKTKGNLNTDESKVLANALSNLQMAFVEAARESDGKQDSSGVAGSSTAASAAEPSANHHESGDVKGDSKTDGDHKKKFVKSYGA
jgi:hypothetical protein